MSVPANRAAQVRVGVWVEVFTVLWMVVEAAVSLGAGVLARSALLTAFGIEGFSSQGRQASLRFGFGVVSGAIAGAFAAGAVTISLASGQPGVPDRIPTFYWLWGPGLAVVGGIGGMLLERKHER